MSTRIIRGSRQSNGRQKDRRRLQAINYSSRTSSGRSNRLKRSQRDSHGLLSLLTRGDVTSRTGDSQRRRRLSHVRRRKFRQSQRVLKDRPLRRRQGRRQHTRHKRGTSKRIRHRVTAARVTRRIKQNSKQTTTSRGRASNRHAVGARGPTRRRDRRQRSSRINRNASSSRRELNRGTPRVIGNRNGARTRRRSA